MEVTFMKHLLMLFVLSFIAVSCSGESEESSTSFSSSTISNPLTLAVDAVVEEAQSISGVIPTSSLAGASTQGLYQPMTAGGFGDEWTTTLTGLMDDREDSTETSPKEWMGIQVDKDAERTNGSKISALGRLENSLAIFCAIGVGLGSSSTYPSNGSHSVTLSGSVKTAIESQCEMEIEGEMEGATVSLNFEDAEDTTYYDKKITINAGFTQVYYVRYDTSEINIATSETSSVDSENDYISRTVIAYDLTTNILKLEYVSGPNSTLGNTDKHVDAYRLYIDGSSADKGYLMGMSYDDISSPMGTDQTETTHYLLAGKPEAIKDEVAGQTVALSFMSDKFGDTNARQACIDASNGDIATDKDNSLACSLTGTDVEETETGAEILISGYDNTLYASVSSSTTLSFDENTFATAVFSEN